VQTQVDPRVRKRLHCTLSMEARQHNGLVLNLSERGLFVQTSLPAEPGTLLALDVRDPVRGEPIPLQAAVVWRRRVSPRMTGVNQSGMGLRLIDRPPAWQAMMSSLLSESAGPGTPPVARTVATAVDPAPRSEAAPTEPLFVVRLVHEGGPRTRRMLVRGECERSAGEAALREAGEGWTLLEVRRR